jgi:hypothetical protein
MYITTSGFELVRRPYLLRIKIFLAIGVFFEQFPRAMTQQFVVRDLDLEGLRFPCLVQGKVIGVDEWELV